MYRPAGYQAGIASHLTPDGVGTPVVLELFVFPDDRVDAGTRPAPVGEVPEGTKRMLLVLPAEAARLIGQSLVDQAARAEPQGRA